jgi:hypothetical protein
VHTHIPPHCLTEYTAKRSSITLPLTFWTHCGWVTFRRRTLRVDMAMSDQGADNYRHQAAEIREAAEIVRDQQFREQLLGIAQQYEAVAARMQLEAHAKRDAGSTFRPAQEAIIVPISTRLYPSSKSAPEYTNSAQVRGGTGGR